MASIEIFKNESFGEVRVAGTSEEPLFCLSDVCRVLEIKNVADCKSRLDQRGVVLTDTPTHNQYGVEIIQKLVYINEKNLYKVIMRSDKPQAEPFQDWVCGEVLPTLRKTGQYSVQNPKVKQLSIRDELFWIEKSKKILNLNDTSVLKMLQQIAAPYGLPVPDYTPSKGILKSATELLKERGYSISAQVFNYKAVELGYLQELTRNSSGGKKKKFKSITEKGKPYGENQVNPNNPKETQPLWYEDKFDELLVKLGFAEGRVAV